MRYFLGKLPKVLIPLALTGLLIGVAIWATPRAGSGTASGEIWTCSMHPQIRLPNPGQCPICGMKLIPVSQLSGAKEDLEKRAGLETEAVRHRELFKEIRTVGKVDYSERQVELITARVAGRVDRVYADFTGIAVKKNDHLVDIYSPDLFSAQSELLRALEAAEGVTGDRRFVKEMLDASRAKLQLLGILPQQIAELEKNRQGHTHLTIYAPLGGTVIEKDIRVGQYVNAGDQLYRIANLDPIWLYLNIYEFDLAWVRFGQTVEVTMEAFPGEIFRGMVTFIDPSLDDATRTLRVRVNLKNSDHRLKPQMYANATIRVPLRADGSPEPTGLEGKYICPMHPEVIQPEPGKCSICEMPLERIPELPAVLAPSSPQSPQRERNAENADQTAPREQATKPERTPAVIRATPESETDENAAEKVADKTADRGELAIPVSAVLDTGRRRIAYRLTKDGAYELVELKLGPRAQAIDDSGRRRDYYLVLDGLNDGDKVVVQSGFLLDSQRQIEGMPSLLYATGQAASMTGHAGHGGPTAQAGSNSPTPLSPSTTMPAGHKH